MTNIKNSYLLVLLVSIFGLILNISSLEIYCPNGQIDSVHNLTWVYTYPDDSAEGNRCIRVTPHLSNNKEIKTINIEISNYDISSGNLTIFYGYWPSEKNKVDTVISGTSKSYTVNSPSYFIYLNVEAAGSHFTIQHNVDMSGKFKLI